MVTGIQVEGGYFSSPIQLEFFNKHRRMVLLYGRNGSGKSTIGEAFLRAGESEEDRNARTEAENTLRACYLQNGQIASSQLKIVSHVFNEEFIDANVKLSEDGIGTVVLFGDAGMAQKMIEEIEPSLRALHK